MKQIISNTYLSQRPFRYYKDQIEQVAHWLSGYGVKKLEQLATALYVVCELPDAVAATRQSRLQEYKPHVSDEEARAAIEEVREMKKVLAEM